MIIDELIALLGFETKGADDLRRFNDGLADAERKAQAVANRINMMSVAIGTFVGQMAVDLARGIGRTIGSLPGDIIGVGSVFEKLETTLTTIEGSSDKAKAALDWVADFAATTPYELNEVAEAFVRMRAYGLDPMSGQLEGVGNAASAMGKGLMQGVEAIADAVTGENERLKEFGIRASAEKDKITYTWQQAGETMTKTVKKDGTEIANALMEIFSRFDGAMEAQSKTWEGMTSNFGDQWTAFLKQISDAGYYEDVKRRFRGMVDVIDGWRERGYLDRAAQSISNFLTGSMFFAERIGRVLWDFGKAAYYAASGMVDLVSSVTGLNKAASAGLLGAAAIGSTKTGRALMLALAKRVPALAAFLLVEDIMGALRGDESYIGKLEGGQEAIDKLRSSWEQLGEAAERLSKAVSGLFGFDLPKDHWLFNPTSWMDRALVAYVNNLANAFNGLAGAVDALANARWSDLLPNLGSFSDAARNIVLPGSGYLNDKIKNWLGGGSEKPAATQSSPPSDGGRDDALGSFLDDPEQSMRNFRAHMNKMSSGAATEAVVNDNSVANDNRDQSVNVGAPNVTVNVQQPVEAPAELGRRLGNATNETLAPLGRRVTGN